MTKTELRHIAEDLVDELRELPDGAEITSGQLLKRIGYDPKELSEEELFGYNNGWNSLAAENRIGWPQEKNL